MVNVCIPETKVKILTVESQIVGGKVFRSLKLDYPIEADCKFLR